MIKTKLLTWIALLLLILACTACHGQNDDKSVKSALSTPSVNNSGQHIQRQLDTNLSVDADVIASSNIQKLDTLHVTPIRFDTQVQALETSLIANSKVIQKKDYVDSGSRYLTADGKELFVGRGTVNFQTDKFRTYLYQILITRGNTTNNLDRFSQKRNLDLPFTPHQLAVDEVKKVLTSLGIYVYDEIETYSLDYQTLQAQEKVLKENGNLTSPKDGSITLKDSWSEDDDCYYMVFRSGFDKIPIYPNSHGSVEANTFVPSAYITACYSKKGLEYLAILDTYQKKDVDQEGLKIISFEEALAAVKHKYGNVILTEPITVTSIELNYVPMLINQSRDEFRLVPSWCLDLKKVVKDGKGETHTVHSRMIINATTGGEIL